MPNSTRRCRKNGHSAGLFTWAYVFFYCHLKTLRMFEKSSVQTRPDEFPVRSCASGSFRSAADSPDVRVNTTQCEGSRSASLGFLSQIERHVRLRLAARFATTGLSSKLRLEI